MSFKNFTADFFYPLPFLKYKGPKRLKTRFSVECKLTVKHMTLIKHVIMSNTLLCQTHYCVKQVLESYLFLWTLLLSICCSHIMLHLQSPSACNIIMYWITVVRRPFFIQLQKFCCRIMVGCCCQGP